MFEVIELAKTVSVYEHFGALIVHCNVISGMDGFGDNFDQPEVDPAAEFLAREQDQLAGLEDDLDGVAAPPRIDGILHIFFEKFYISCGIFLDTPNKCKRLGQNLGPGINCPRQRNSCVAPFCAQCDGEKQFCPNLGPELSHRSCQSRRRLAIGREVNRHYVVIKCS
jgi:hypothetical protein